MKIRYNFGILKNSIIYFKFSIDGNPFCIGGKLVKVEQDKELYKFIFENDKKFGINENTFLHMQIKYSDNILYFEETDNQRLISGLFGFTMFETFGFPYELSDEILAGMNFDLDIEGVENLRKFQKDKFKSTFKKKTSF